MRYDALPVIDSHVSSRKLLVVCLTQHFLKQLIENNALNRNVLWEFMNIKYKRCITIKKIIILYWYMRIKISFYAQDK